MSYVYLFCLSVGFFFTVAGAVLSGVLGHSGGGHDGGGIDADAGGVDADAGGFHADAGGIDADASGVHTDIGFHADAGHGGNLSHDAGGSLQLPVFSPTVIAFFLATFGASGLLYQRVLGIQNPWIHTPMAGATAVASGIGLAYVLYKITSGLESNRMARVSDAMLAPVEVTISVPKEGMGEIAYVSAGTRQTISARTVDGREHKQGSMVRVLKIVDGVAFVGETLPAAALGERVAPVAGEPVQGEPVRLRQR
jgi:hypothetical protein